MRPFFIFTALSIFFAEGYSIQRPFLIPVSHQQTPRYTSGVPGLNGLESIRCGAFKQAASDSDVSASAQIGIISKALAAFGNAWGSLGVVYILAKAIKRVLPIALEPFMKDTALVFSSVHWSLYAITCAFFAYAEGYKGFQKKFSPLVVKRSSTLILGTRSGNNPLHYLFAPLYSMGLIHATKKRLITSWGVTTGVTMLVALVKRLPPASRCILDAGVVVGLTYGSMSILYLYLKALITGKTPPVDPCLD